MAEGVFRKYKDFNFRDERLRMIGRVNAIIAEYGTAMSVRQIHYQFVARDWFENTPGNYDKITNAISDGRMAGLISWTAIEDRNRYLQGVSFHNNPHAALEAARDAYKIDLWADQEWRPTVLSEKASSEGTISQVCLELRVNYLSLRGYNSQSMSWELGQRFAGYYKNGQRPIVFHIGDHDPSGVDMTRDNRERLETFCGVPVLVQRLALNMDQIEKYNPPPNFAKDKDSRTEGYVAQFGTDECWEVDALAPPVLQGLIRDAILSVRDEKKWDALLEQEVSDIRFIDDLISGPSLGEGEDDANGN